MSRNHPDNIFKYPPVQYIPLSMKNKIKQKYSYSFSRTGFSLYRPGAQDSLNDRLNFLINHSENYSINNDELGILIQEGTVDYIKYRAHEIFMVGNNNPQTLQVFKITTKYFYKNNLIFSFYNKNSGDRIDRESYTFNPNFRKI
ncbi:MAG: hypothetical protein ACOC4G_05390 [Bacillota bacterium]